MTRSGVKPKMGLTTTVDFLNGDAGDDTLMLGAGDYGNWR